VSGTVSAQATCGLLIGRRTRHGAAFLGVRYAEPPTGPRRFLPPQPIAPAKDPVDAREPGPAPPQIMRPRPPWAPVSAISATSEDCLTLNVWTPAVDGAGRPVLVHVFGGGFQTGSAFGGPQDAEALSAQGDIVVVRVNFRIGALGFLHLGGIWGDRYLAGNLGLLDLVAALEWVAQNIRSLGGDPDKVTVLGLSSGAFMIAALFALPQTRGLFRRAVMQSGSASRIIAAKTAAAMAESFLDRCGVKPGNRKALEALDVATILAAQEAIVEMDLGARNAPGGRTLGVVLDGLTLREHPMVAFERGDRRDAAVILGVTRDEARLWTALGIAGPVTEETLGSDMVRFAGVERGGKLFAAYRERYPDATFASLRERFLSDGIYIVAAWRTAMAHAKAGGKTFFYEFAWTPPYAAGRLGAAHGFDEPFLWGVADPARVPFVRGAEEEAKRLAECMSTCLVGFVRDGDPGWPPVSETGPSFQVFGGRQPVEGLSEIAALWSGIDRA
jgi:para-nitrobenzyl esterase